MSTRPIPARTRYAGVELGEHLRTWRILHNLTAEQLAERAGVSRGTVSRLEQGETSVGMAAFLNVARSLGVLDLVVKAMDPYETPLGRARADQLLPKRVRQKASGG